MEKNYSLTFNATPIATISPTIYFRTLSDLIIRKITVRGVRKESSEQDVRATLSCKGYSVTEDIGTGSTDISLTDSITISKGESFYFSLINSGGKILLPYQNAEDEPIEAYAVADSGLVLQSTSACSFEITYTVITEAVWEVDPDVNGGLPYFAPTLYPPAENPVYEITSPKPWWVWKIDPNGIINDGYPYIIPIGGEPEPLTGTWYFNGLEMQVYINGNILKTYYIPP